MGGRGGFIWGRSATFLSPPLDSRWGQISDTARLDAAHPFPACVCLLAFVAPKGREGEASLKYTQQESKNGVAKEKSEQFYPFELESWQPHPTRAELLAAFDVSCRRLYVHPCLRAGVAR